MVEGWGACERAVWGIGERAGMRVGALDLGSGCLVEAAREA